MAKEDLLPVEMGKLEIEPIKSGKIIKEENPFISKTQQKICNTARGHLLHTKCSCSLQKVTICKKKTSKIIKDPVLKILQNRTSHHGKEEGQPGSRKFYNSVSQNLNSDILNLCALVDDCNQLRISSEEKKHNLSIREASSKNDWWKNDISHARQTRKSALDSKAGSCSQQALNPPCDVTIDELASYFETLVHIPKKMSSMAEMMYI